MRENLFRVTACFLLLLFPHSVLAVPAQATVQAQGSVMVNGSHAGDMTSIFAGDKIQTGPDGVATITSEGIMVQMDPGSSAVYSNQMISIGCGGVMVTTTVGTIIRVAGVAITPAAQNTTKVQVSHGNGVLKITARENWAVVHDGTTSKTLAPKETLTLDRPGASCEPLAQVPQASTRIYIPAAAAVSVGPLVYCSTHWFCSQSSPSAP